jgi:small subunit ribosomal protein S7
MRKGRAKRRVLIPDPKFQDVLVTRFVNNLMRRGKKQKAFRIFYEALDIIKERTKEDGIQLWKKALSNVSPQVEVRTRRIGGANYQIPQEVRPERKISLAMKWLIKYANERNEHTMAENLATEIIAASKNEGGAWKKKEEVHRMAEANKAYSHFKIN